MYLYWTEPNLVHKHINIGLVIATCKIVFTINDEVYYCPTHIIGM